MYLKRILFFIILSIAPLFLVLGQQFHGKLIDATSKEGIPFAKLNHISGTSLHLTDLQGNFHLKASGVYNITHPYHEDTSVVFNSTDTFRIELNRKITIPVTDEQLEQGEKILLNFHKFFHETKTTKHPEFEFLSSSNISVFEESYKNSENWELLNSLESLEKNRFKFPDKKYSKVVYSHFHDGDSSTLGYIPINTYSISAENEYINAINLKYYNPLFKGAHRRYDYSLVDTFQLSEGTVRVVYFRPKPKKHFIGLEGLLYFINDKSEGWGGYLKPHTAYNQKFSLSFYLAPTDQGTRFLKDLYAVLKLKNIPNYNRNSRLYYTTINTPPEFATNSSSNKKWVDMALFNHEKDSALDDTWMMTQMVDKEKLEYIKKDTSNRKFVMTNTLKWMYNIYDGKLGVRVRFFDINNVFAINKVETVRIGLGLQSHENLSDVFTFGGYFGYGIGDGKFKYGGNMGVYFGKARSNLLSVEYTKDLLEPGLVHFLDKRQDLVKEFFTSRMDEYTSLEISLRTKINSYLTSTVLLNNYSLKPLYDYIYNPEYLEIAETQTFNFTETTFLFNVGTPFSNNPNLRNILYRKKRIRSNLFLNLTKGWDTEYGGDFDYWKISSRLKSNFRIKRKGDIDLVLDGGIMTRDQPYQVNYGAPGTEFKLTGIIINNAFQTMKLYGFFADRYVHSFINYNLGNVFFTKSKFRPELAFALNLGWGKISGRKDIHENIEVTDYPKGFYEAGIMLNNLLRLKIYDFFYGGLGVGAFVGFGPEVTNTPFAIRISYEIGTL